MKATVAKVSIDRAEGPHDLCIKSEFTSVEDAQKFLASQADTFPGAPGQYPGGYDKHDIVITFSDNELVEFRLDAKFTGHDIMANLRSFLGFYAGLYCPPHMKPADYELFLARDDKSGSSRKADFLDFIATHECGL